MNLLRRASIGLTLGAAVFLGLWAPPSWGGPSDMDLSSADKQLLLHVARDSIAAHLQGKAAAPLKACRRLTPWSFVSWASRASTSKRTTTCLLSTANH